MDVTKEYSDVLQNIEFAVVNEYKTDRRLTDSHVRRVYSSLIDYYKQELRGKEPQKPGMSKKASELFDVVRGMCEWRLGRKELESGETDEEGAVNLQIIVRCLTRLRQSVKTWEGKTGYLDYVAGFMGEAQRG